MPKAWDVVPKGQKSPFRADVLAGRTALITGGGSGIGLEIARQIGQHGGRVVIMGRRQEFLDRAVESLRADGVTAASSTGDVRRPDDCAKAVATAVRQFGSLDILVNSAAGNFLSPAEGLSPNAFKTVMEIDTQGVFNMCRTSFEALKDSRFGGNIINITATLHYGATHWQAHPSAAKAAIDSLTRSLALEWGEYGIRSNGIAPGPIADTPGLTKLAPGQQSEEAKATQERAAARAIPIGRLGTRFDVAMAAVFICCDAGSNISGDVLVSDGGNWLMKPPSIPKQLVVAASRGVEKASRAKM